MQVVTINMPDGSVAGHRAGCRDIARVTRNPFAEASPAFDFETKHAVWLDYNTDFLAEGSGAWPIDWKACADALPQGEPDDEDAYSPEA